MSKIGRVSKIGRLFAAQHGRCRWCQHPMVLTQGCEASATLDHVKPRSLGGDNSIYNMVAACQRCNNLRGNMLVEDWKKVIPVTAPLALLRGHRRKR